MDYFNCSGCAVCALVCPVWTQTHDVALTPWGRAKAIQGGATAHDIKDSIESCLSCGACETICPEKINVPLQESLMRIEIGQSESLGEMVSAIEGLHFFPSAKLKTHSAFTQKLESLLQKHAKRNEYITDNFLWHRQLIQNEKKKKVFGLGEWLFNKKLIQEQLQGGDLYWMDAPLFHNRYEDLVAFYADLRQKRSCHLNWNLQRTAMPLGEDNVFFKREKQFNWVLFNKDIKRIVVENIQDWQWIKENTSMPVIHVLELVGDS